LCPVCAADRAARLEAYAPAEWDVVECGECKMVYLRNPPAYETLQDEFAWERTYAEKRKLGGSTAFSGINRWIRAKLGLQGGRRTDRRFLGWFGAGPVLDIGCGGGNRVLPPMVPYGIELSNALWKRSDAAMRQHGGHCLHEAGATGIWKFDAGFFNGVIMHSYLEHEIDVAGVLDGAHRALKPGGMVFVRVPNFGSINRRVVGKSWCGFRHPDHVNYFNLASLRAVAAKAGFSIKLVNRWNLWFDDNIQALLVKQPKEG
jgi:2-polyprenyl-3-methyl-5-hydroxy-6-metoxy-1,4-benzoquinol methylase